METDKIKQQLYNSRIIDTYIKLIKRKYSYVNISELLQFAKMEPYEVADQGHWFDQEQVDLFYERLVKLTGNENIAREAGRYAASPEAIGVMRQYVLGLVSPAKVYEMIGKTTKNFTRSSVYESRKLASNKVEITVTLEEGVQEKRFQCENRIGFMEAIAEVFNCKLPSIEHPECLFENGNVCRYIISWEKPASVSWTRIRNYSASILFVLCAVSFCLGGWLSLIAVFPSAVSIILLVSLVAVCKEKQDLNAGLDNLRESTDKLLEQINQNYNNALMTNEIGQAINKQTDIDAILSNVIHVLQKRLDYDRCMIFLTDQDKTRLLFRAGFGYSEELENLFKKTTFHLDRPESRGIFVISFREQKPYLINDFDEIKTDLSPHSLTFAKKLGAQSFIVCPIVCDGNSLGILVVDNVQTKKPLLQSHMNLLMGISTVIGISIRNAMLNEYRVHQFSSTLQVLAASIDTRDNLTAGHAEKVTKYAVGICRELGLGKDYCEMIRVAALLHDYGKIGIPDSILKKEGRLTEEEYDEVKSHASKTREILAQINFEGIYRQVPEIAGSHHEKIDGSGYPAGLKGQEIPFGAKIIAVADFFEAITAKRHYRDPMPLSDAVRLLKEHVGKHFEKRVVNAFLDFMKKNPDFINEASRQSFPIYALHRERESCMIPLSLVINGTTLAGACEDISAGGMYVASDCDVKCGSMIELAFTLPCNDPCEFHALGRVVWLNCAEIPTNEALPTGFGIEFLDVKPSREILREAVSSIQPENRFIAESPIAGNGPIYASAGEVVN
ncbi:MAG: HD domain-containing phosphohydrolase [Geobacteraceae bacterium]|nr:HD domain-containing phosphohydrolase [Geobacteraceae bacterium]